MCPFKATGSATYRTQAHGSAPQDVIWFVVHLHSLKLTVRTCHEAIFKRKVVFQSSNHSFLGANCEFQGGYAYWFQTLGEAYRFGWLYYPIAAAAQQVHREKSSFNLKQNTTFLVSPSTPILTQVFSSFGMSQTLGTLKKNLINIHWGKLYRSFLTGFPAILTNFIKFCWFSKVAMLVQTVLRLWVAKGQRMQSTNLPKFHRCFGHFWENSLVPDPKPSLCSRMAAIFPKPLKWHKIEKA